MADYAQLHYQRFGFRSPSRTKPYAVAFSPYLLQHGVPALALEAGQFDPRFGFRIAFVDKSLFRAVGGLWHKRT